MKDGCRRLDPRDRTYKCLCHERMGNDFWFLPKDRCLYDDTPPKLEQPK